MTTSGIYQDRLHQAFHNDVRVLNETGIRSANPIEAVAKIRFIGGYLRNSPESFPAAKDVWSFFAIPEFSDALVGTEYFQLNTLRVGTTKDIFDAYLENAVSQGKGLITYIPSEVSKVKTTLNNWSYSIGSSPIKKAVDSASNMFDAMVVASDLYNVLVEIYGVEGLRMRMSSLLTSRGRGIGPKERKLDYGIFIPRGLSATGDAFKALRTVNQALSSRYYPHLNLPEHSNEFDIRAGLSGTPIGQYLIQCERELVELLRNRKN